MYALTKCVIALSSLLLGLGVCASTSEGVMKEWSRRHAFVNPEKTDEIIVNQWRGGQWQRAELEGVFRFLVTSADSGAAYSGDSASNSVSSSNQASKLYIQWVETKSGKDEIVFSISVDELNVQPRYRFGLPVCDAMPACDAIILNVHDVYEDRDQLFRFAIEGLGQYKFHL